MFWVYIVECKGGLYYTGHTDNLETRIAQHNDGTYEGFTSKRKPVKLVFAELFNTRDDAFRAEMKIKHWSRAKKEALIKSDWKKISELAKKKFEGEQTNHQE